MIRKLANKALSKIRRTPPVESVSIDEAFPSIEKHVLIESKEIATPETRDMKFSAFYAHVDGPTYTTPAVYTALLDSVLFCPRNNCITTESRTVIKESAGPGAKTFNVHAPSIQHANLTEFIPGFCTALRCTFDNFYHLLIDNLSRFDLLNHDYFSEFDEIKLLCPGGLRHTEEYFITKLLPSNVKIVPIRKGVLYRPEKYIFNSFPTQRGSAYIPGSFIERFREKTRPTAPVKGGNRIYVSRADAKQRRVLNENCLTRRLREYGFESYGLSKLSLRQQINLFYSADIVVAPHGAGLSNLLFADRTSVLELHPAPTVATHFYMLSKRMGHQYKFVTHGSKNTDSDFHAYHDCIEEKLNMII